MGKGLVMEGAVDIKFLVTLGGILFSVAGAAAVGKMQIKSIMESLGDIEKRLRDLDKRCDAMEATAGITSSRVNVLSDINSVSALATYNSKITRLEVLLDETIKTQKQHRHEYMSAHNGSHPPIKD